MFGYKVKIEKEDRSNETIEDLKQAFKVTSQEFAKAYHKRKVRSFEHSLNRLRELEGDAPK